LAGHCGALPAAAGGSRRPPSRHPDHHRHHPRGRTARPVQQRAARRGRTGMAPTPAAYPSPAGRATLAGRLRPLGLDPPATAPGRLPGPAAAPAVNGPLAQRRQRPRRRITPNTKTSTTTTISTHNHVDMAASLVGAGQFKLTLLPPTRASNSVTARRPPVPGIDGNATHGLVGTPAPRDLPADLGLAGRLPRWGRALRATPSQPNPNRIDQHHKSGGPGRRQPTQRDHSDPGRRGRARPSSVCPAWVGEQSKHGCADAQWQTPRRRRRTDGAGLRRNPNLCRGRLHRPAVSVQPARCCAIHQGWDQQKVTRPRRRCP
jgi:hypothetical protein